MISPLFLILALFCAILFGACLGLWSVRSGSEARARFMAVMLGLALAFTAAGWWRA